MAKLKNHVYCTYYHRFNDKTKQFERVENAIYSVDKRWIKHKTKLSINHIPEYYVRVGDYWSEYFFDASSIVKLRYEPCAFPNHPFRDDYLTITYKDAEYEDAIWGWDLVHFIRAVEKFSPNVDTSDIRRMMVESYNKYADSTYEITKKIASIDELTYC